MNKFILSSIIIFNSLIAGAQTADEIISKNIEFRGGSKNLKAVKTIVSSGKYLYGGMEFTFKSYSKAPDLYKYEVSLNGKFYTQSFDGKRGWRTDGFNNETEPTFLTDKPAVSMANETDVELESTLINYKKKGNKVEAAGTETVADSLCFKINLTRKNGEKETYYFNTNSFELVMKTAVSKNAELKDAVIDTYYSDYRQAGSIKVPFKSVSKIKEQVVLTIIAENVEVNTVVQDGEFQP